MVPLVVYDNSFLDSTVLIACAEVFEIETRVIITATIMQFREAGKNNVVHEQPLGAAD